jgi:hypothetical protein
MALIVTPLTAETIKLSNSMAKHERTKKATEASIAATKKRIGELEIEKNNEADPAKKAIIQDKIALENDDMDRLTKKLTSDTELIALEKQKLAAINVVLARTTAEADVAAHLSSAFTTFFQAITNPTDKKELSTLAKAVLRQYILGFTHLLRLSIHSGGSEMVLRKFAWWNLRPAFIGGCVISYNLVTNTGEVVKSGMKIAAGQRKFSFRQPTETKVEIIPTYDRP